MLLRQIFDLRQMAAMVWDIISQLTLLSPSSELILQVSRNKSSLHSFTAHWAKATLVFFKFGLNNSCGLAMYLQWSRNTVKMCLITWRRRSSGPDFSSPIIFTETASAQEHKTSSPSVPNRMKKVPWYNCDIQAEHTKNTCQHFLFIQSFLLFFFLHFIIFVLFYFNRSVFYLSNVGLKSMVEQGVRNPLVDLLSLEDKTLDEVGFHKSLL